MAYPQFDEYDEAVQNPAHSFFDKELKTGSVKENALGLPLVLSGGNAFTYTVSTVKHKYAVRCFKRESPSIESRYHAVSKTLNGINGSYFVGFEFQKAGIRVKNNTFPIVRMDWIEGDPLGVWMDKHYDNPSALQKACIEFRKIAAYLEKQGIAHGDIQNGNVMMSNSGVKLIDYDGMFVPSLPVGNGAERGHRHFQHPKRSGTDYGPSMDRFSFISLDLSFRAVIEDKTLYKRFREGGETIIFRANDFADPTKSDIFRLLLKKPQLKADAETFAIICRSDIRNVPTLSDFLGGKYIPGSQTPKATRQNLGYISAFPVVDALNFADAASHVGDRIELIGQIVEIKADIGRRGRAKNKPYVFINFGPWRGNIVKLSFWSDGLEKLSEQPSNAWKGRWVSVTGLLDPPFLSIKYGYTHLSISVSDDGQIQFIDEAQARFRLNKQLSSPPPPASEVTRGKSVVRTGTASAVGVAHTPTAAATGIVAPPPKAAGTSNSTTGSASSGTTASRNRDIVNQIVGANSPPPPPASPVQPTPISHPGLQPSATPSWLELLGRIPWWVWVSLVLGLIVFLGQSNSKRVGGGAITGAENRSNVSLPRPYGSDGASPPWIEITTPPGFPDPVSPAPLDPELSPPPHLPPAILVDEISGRWIPGRSNSPMLPGHMDVRRLDDAKRLQQRLIDLGFLAGSADGIWGTRSRNALMAFRVASELGKDDLLDEATESRIFSDSAVHAPPSHLLDRSAPTAKPP